LTLVARAATPERGQLDASPTLFAVMAAINAAGYNADIASQNNSPLRDAIRKELAGKNIPCLPALQQFYRLHRADDATAELSQYISFALSVDGPPSFALKGRTVDAPPDVAALDGFSALMMRFYHEADVEELWKRSQPAFEAAIERYHEPVADAVLQVNGFLRNETSGTSARWFQIYVDLLGAPNQIQTRSYGRDYFVVITPSAEPRIFDVRHAYLHYLLDPMATRHEEVIMHTRGLADHAQRAPSLDQSFKSDYLLLVTESLIKAIEARMDKKPAVANDAMKQGYILTAFFAEQVQAYLKQEQAMRFFYPTMIAAIDLKREDARLAGIEFAAQAPVRREKDTGAGRSALCRSESGRRPRALFEVAGADRRSGGARAGLLRAGADRGARKESGDGGAVVPEDAGVQAGPADQSVDAGVSGPPVGCGRRQERGHQTLQGGPGGRGRVPRGS